MRGGAGALLLLTLLSHPGLADPVHSGGAGEAAASRAGEESEQDSLEEAVVLVVASTADSGKGSLRQAIATANSESTPVRITFDAEVFAEPQTIVLASELPTIRGRLTIDGYIPGRLWKANGALISGDGKLPVFRVAPAAQLTLRYVTVVQGRASEGGGVANRGRLVLRSVTFLENAAARRGGAVANLGGEVEIVNSTFAYNRAGRRGGALASPTGRATLTNSTFSENAAPQGGAVYSRGQLLLRNSILANSDGGSDCSARRLDPASTRNLIEINDGCGEPISSDDPHLETLGYYNGPTRTFPVSGGSPTINLGDNAAALDEHGATLVWDQRGSGDPRFVAGYTDLGAFEHQRHPELRVDTTDDSPLRACTRAGLADCPLRGALELAEATPEPDVITFDPQVFADPRTILLERPPPQVTTEIRLDAEGSAGLRVIDAEGTELLRLPADGEGEWAAGAAAGNSDSIAPSPCRPF